MNFENFILHQACEKALLRREEDAHIYIYTSMNLSMSIPAFSADFLRISAGTRGA